MIKKCKEIIDESQYIKISEEKGLNPTCPIINRCERRIATIYGYSYQKPDTRYAEKINIIEKLNKTYLSDNEKISMLGNQAYSYVDTNFYSYRYMCPEVNLFDGSNRIVHKPELAVSAFEWDKYSDHKEIIITECKHYSECLEYKKHQYEEKEKVKTYSFDHYDIRLKEKISVLVNDSHLDSAIRACFVILTDHLRNKFNIENNIDGEALINKIFSKNSPYLTDINDKDSYRNLFSGFYGVFRNLHAHNNTEPSFSEALSIAEMTNHLIKIIDNIA